MSDYTTLPAGLPHPVDDGACNHLPGLRIPHLTLPSTGGRAVDLGALGAGRTVIYCYPMTGVPGRPLPADWDLIPGARGCTPQACSFRDHHRELGELGAGVFGLSTQSSGYQREAALFCSVGERVPREHLYDRVKFYRGKMFHPVLSPY